MYTRPDGGRHAMDDGASFASSHFSGLPPGHSGMPVTLSAHSCLSSGHSGANRVVDALASGTVKEQRLKSARGQDIAIFVEMDDGGGDVFLSGRVSPRLPASGARVTFRLSLTEEHRWVAKNGEWLYESMAWPEPADPRLAPPRRRPGRRVDGVVSTRKPSSACCWVTTGDLNGGVYCLSKSCPSGQSPPLGAIVTFELKQGKYGDWRVAYPPGLAVVGHESVLLERTLLDRGTPPMIGGPMRHDFAPPPLMTPSMASSMNSRESQQPVVSLQSNTWAPPVPAPRSGGYLDNIQANLAHLMGRVRVNGPAAAPMPPPRAVPPRDLGRHGARGPSFVIDDAPRRRSGSLSPPDGWQHAPRPFYPGQQQQPAYDS
jgi:hypothetical protein